MFVEFMKTFVISRYLYICKQYNFFFKVDLTFYSICCLKRKVITSNL